jgi:hypothetical protein
MITREEIEKMFTYNCVDRAIKYCRRTYPHYDGDKMGEITDAFEAGAEWSKDFIIERAIKWLNENVNVEELGITFNETNFREAMDD